MPTSRPNSTQSPLSEQELAASAAISKQPLAVEDPLDQLGDATDDAQLIGQVVAGRYRIVELLGRGGMGAVYRADHVHIHKSFALKVLHRELTHHVEAVKRFEREAIAAARIDHPNVATATDFGQLESGAFFLVLDYVQGRSLRQLLIQQRQLPELRALRITRQIASALGAAHAAGIVHRDLKPDNVMLVEGATDTDLVKVLDFGIAKLRTEDLKDEPAITRFGTVFGTPEYMSPEQAIGQAVDSRSDLYALGIMLYEMLVGRTPFADEQLVVILARHMTEAPSDLPASVSRQTRELVMGLLEKQPQSRPQHADQIISEIDSHLLGMSAVDDHANLRPSGTKLTSEEDMATGSTLFATGSLPQSGLIRTATQPEQASPRQGGRAMTPSMRSPSIPPWLRRHVTISGRRIPWIVIAMVACLGLSFVMGSFGVWALLRRPGREESSKPSVPLLSGILGDSAERKQLKALMESAKRGEPAALARLDARPTSARGGDEWAAIAAGRAQLKQWTTAVVAYDSALNRDPALMTDPRLLADVFLAAQDAQASAGALNLAVRRLGSTGADLIYAVIEASIYGRAPKADRKLARSLLESLSMSGQISRPLDVVLKLESARTCSDFKAQLPDVERFGDQRSQRILRKLNHDRGCGFLGLQDCYGCLRGTRALSTAQEATKSRPGPSFADVSSDGHVGRGQVD